jgi:hypothetical protein
MHRYEEVSSGGGRTSLSQVSKYLPERKRKNPWTHGEQGRTGGLYVDLKNLVIASAETGIGV